MDIDVFSIAERESDTELKARILVAAENNVGPYRLNTIVMELAFARGARVDEIAKRFQLVRVEPVTLLHY